MIRINLLPPSERTSDFPLTRMMGASVFLLLLVVAGVYGYGLYTELTLQQELQQARNRYELLRPTQEKMLAANQKQQAITSRSAILTTLTKERKSWHAVLSHLGVATPVQVWLTEVTAGDKNLLLIKGMAATYPDLADFIEKLAQDSFFADPVLIKAERDSALPATRFELSVKIKGI